MLSACSVDLMGKNSLILCTSCCLGLISGLLSFLSFFLFFFSFFVCFSFFLFLFVCLFVFVCLVCFVFVLFFVFLFVVVVVTLFQNNQPLLRLVCYCECSVCWQRSKKKKKSEDCHLFKTSSSDICFVRDDLQYSMWTTVSWCLGVPHGHAGTHRDTYTETERDTQTHIDTERHTQTHIDTERHTQTHIDTERHTDTHRQRETHRHT